MFKKAMLGGVLAISLMIGSVPAFAASTCPKTAATSPANYQNLNNVKGTSNQSLNDLINQLKALCSKQKKNGDSAQATKAIKNCNEQIAKLLANKNCPKAK